MPSSQTHFVAPLGPLSCAGSIPTTQACGPTTTPRTVAGRRTRPTMTKMTTWPRAYTTLATGPPSSASTSTGTTTPPTFLRDGTDGSPPSTVPAAPSATSTTISTTTAP